MNRNASIFPVLDNVFATRELCALALDLPPEKSGMSLSLEFSRRENIANGVDVIKNMPRYDRVLIDATRPLEIPFPGKNTIPVEVMNRIKLSDYIK